MFIDKKQKPILNTLIHYYRKLYSKTDDDFLTKNFIYDEDGCQICSLPTLNKLENNHTTCADEKHFSLFNNLGMQITTNMSGIECIQESNERILNLAEHNDVHKIIALIDQTVKILQPYKQYVLYREHLELYQLIKQYYQDNTYNQQLIDKYYHLFSFVDESLKCIYITIAYNYYSRVNVITDKSQSIINLLNTFEVESIMYTYLESILLVRKENIIEVKKKCLSLLHQTRLEGNSYYVSKAYNHIAFVHSESNIQEAMYNIKLAIENFDATNDTQETLNIYYRNYANLLYKCEDFEGTVHVYEETIHLDKKFICSFFIFIISSYKKINAPSYKIKQLLNVIQDNYDDLSPFLKTIFNFYKYYYFENDFKKIKANINDLVLFLNNFDTSCVFAEIILSDIKNVCFEHHQYNYYYKTMKNLQ